MPAVSSPLICALSTCEGRNTNTRRGAIGTSSPVLGLRPTRSDFWRTWNVPNDESLTVSPRDSAPQTSSKISSTICEESLRDNPTALKTASVRSARVKVFVLIPCPQKARLSGASQTVGAGTFPVNVRDLEDLAQKCALPAKKGRPPGEPPAHGLHEDQIAPFDAPIGDRDGQRQGNGGRRGVAM